MSLVDERGRLGGRVNLIDAVIAVIILGLIPVAFGAYLLFRTPVPKLRLVRPATVYQGNNLRVTIEGDDLRPFMRITFDTTQGRTFLIGNTKYAVVDLPDLGPGTYDVVLWDYMQEVSRLPKALTVLPLAPTPTVEMEVSGAFKGLAADRVKTMKPGDKFPPTGDWVAEVLSVGAPAASAISLRAGEALLRVPITGQIDLPAVLKLKCFVASYPSGALRCSVPGPLQQADVAPGSALSLATATGWAMYQIDQVHTPPPSATAH